MDVARYSLGTVGGVKEWCRQPISNNRGVGVARKSSIRPDVRGSVGTVTGGASGEKKVDLPLSRADDGTWTAVKSRSITSTGALTFLRLPWLGRIGVERLHRSAFSSTNQLGL